MISKRLVCSIMLMVSFIAILSGCNNQKASGQDKEVVEIEYWHVNNQDWGGETIKELVKQFNEEHPEIVVTEKFQPGNYTGLLQNAQAGISAKNPPDVAQIGYNFIQYVEENVPYTPIEKLESEYDSGFIKEQFENNIAALGQGADGVQAGLPYALSNPILYYNADLLKEAGFNPDEAPKTWDDVKKISAAVKEKTGAYGLYVQEPPDNWAQYALVKSNGGNWMKENGQVDVDSSEAAEAYDMLGELAKKEEALHITWEEGIQAFTSGKVAMMMTTIGRRGNIESESKFDLRGASIPTFGNKERQVAAGGNALFVFSQDKKKQEAAWEFIKFLESEQALTKWVKATGYLPPVKGVAESETGLKSFFEGNPLMQIAIGQMNDIVPWFNFPGTNGLQAEQALLDARDQVMSGKKSGEDALKEAAEKIKKLIQ
ncbi:ABC transporter substrate-binding protein [Bacillus sp. FSL K6-3431]|uniref:ABC transporter substrate-binding protein n=1 Tax=Bacillus sp. FSL K6-3431 TaxID=2921500 RepID=UPI0030F59E1A